MRKLLILLFVIPILCNAQNTWYVATNGDDGNAGTLAQPFKSWAKGFDTLSNGDTLYIRGGEYFSYQSNEISTDTVLIAGYPSDIASSDTTWLIDDDTNFVLGNYPVLNCVYHCDTLVNPYGNVYNSAIYASQQTGVTLEDLAVRSVYQCDSVVTGALTFTSCANLTFDNVFVFDIGQRGYWVTSGAWSYADSAYAVDVNGVSPSSASPPFPQPDTTRWINCDTWNLCDTLAGNPGNAGDAWKTVSYNFNYFLWDGCRAWHYSDDGIDPNGGKRIFNNTWTMATNKFATFGVEGNGFKTSSAIKQRYFDYYTPADSASLVADSMVRATNCLAMFGAGSGFFYGPESDTTCNPRYNNCTSYGNNYGYWDVQYMVLEDTLGIALRNCIADESTTHEIGIYYDDYFETNNTFQRTDGWPYYQANPAFSVTSADFLTTDSTTLAALFKGARKADGSLPDSVPLMLNENSDLVDGGVVAYSGQTYNASAPDLGYYETGGTQDTIPIVSFTYSPSPAYKDSTISYTDNSVNTPTSWDWDFPGGTPDSSAAQNPTVTYASTGTYDVELIASNAYGSDTLLRVNYITIVDATTAPVAEFSANQTTIYEGDSITFTDLSTNTPTSWDWTFEGGTPSTSALQNPTIIYNTAGTYDVVLKATNDGGNDTETKVGYITVSNPYAPASEYKLIIKFR